MKIVVNGEGREVPGQLTISGLLAEMKFVHDRLAVELNRNVVRRLDWETTRLNEGDRVEVVQFVGGGSAG